VNDIDDLGRALAELATRADRAQPPDRLDRIHRRARRTARLRVLTATVVAVVLGGSATALAARAHTATAPQTPATAPTTATPTTPATPATPSATPTSTPNGAASPCLTTGLSVHLGTAQGAAGSTYQPIVFTNTGAYPCTMDGYPGVAFLDTRTGRQVGTPAARNPQQLPRTITLDPGTSASAVLQIVDPFNYPTATCQPQPVTGLRIYPPGTTTPTDLPLPTATTACTTSITQLQVQATVPGSTGQ
jgi:hypothetical protein